MILDLIIPHTGHFVIEAGGHFGPGVDSAGSYELLVYRINTVRRKTPLVQHLIAFERSFAKNTGKHMKLTMSRLRKIVSGLVCESISELTAEAVEDFLCEFAPKKKLGNRTYNHYVQAVDEFGRSLVSSKRSAINTVAGLKRLNTEVDIRHRRRALTPAEIRRLVESARSSGESIQRFDGETRARINILAYMTGLRRNELASLTPASFELDAERPTVTVEAACPKHRRRDVLPLHPELVIMLREWLCGRNCDELLFPKLGRRRTWLMVKKDLERVGIPYVTSAGVADFHAAGRHTHNGIEDQARAIKQLSWHRNSSEANLPESRPALGVRQSNKNRGSVLGVFQVSQAVTMGQAVTLHATCH